MRRDRNVERRRAAGWGSGFRVPGFIFLSLLALTGSGRAVELRATDSLPDASAFGSVVSLAAGNSLVQDEIGAAAYLFRNFETAIGAVTQTARLTAAGGAFLTGDVSISGTAGLVGNPGEDIGIKRSQGSVYLFRNLDTAIGTVTQNAKLAASDGAAEDFFGVSASLSGNVGLVGAGNLGSSSGRGSVYLFRGLDTATGTVTQAAKLLSSDGVAGHFFGGRVSLSGTVGLAGAEGANSGRGAAYVFRNLSTATGTVTENVKLVASDGSEGDAFGVGLSLSGNTGVVGAYGYDNSRGAAYLFRNLDTAVGTVSQSAKLMASDTTTNDQFGYSVGVSGATALVGALGHDFDNGGAYLFIGLNTATGTVTESVLLTATDSTPSAFSDGAFFGSSVSLDGNRFVIGQGGADKAYSGTVSSLTTLDSGSTTEVISRISFASRTDWIIGETTDLNQVRLGLGDRASITTPSGAVYIGKNFGSDSNTLLLEGTLEGGEVYIGALAGNQGNALVVESTAAFEAIAFRLAPDNLIKIEGNYTNTGSLLTYLGDTSLQVWNGSAWETVSETNHPMLIVSTFSSGYTNITAVPEPATGALILIGLSALRVRRRRLNHGRE